MLRQLLVAVTLSIAGLVAHAQTPIVTNPVFGDDSYVHVPLQFGFPFYGRTFTNSWMHSNGVVSFLDPATPIPGAGSNPGAWAYCCSGEQPTIHTPQFSYMIAPLWTDLYPVGSSSFRTEGTPQYQRYFWNNIAEISNMSNLNSFSLEIRPSGFIGVDYTAVRVQNQVTWVGTIGNPTLGEWDRIQHGVPGQTLSAWSFNETVGADLCVVNPLSSPTCPGYTTAMCSTNPLYSTSCSGYAAAYLNQQCASNPLYDTSCPGYAVAYYNYQCTASPLYHSGCPGYAAAYFDQQCALDPLYNDQCPGYADAYYIQQCTANALYDSGCTGYAAAYFDQRCSLDALYSNQCPGYAEAYAKKYVLPSQQPTAEVIVAQAVVEEVVAPQAVVELSATPTASASPADTTAPVQLVPEPVAPSTVSKPAATESPKAESTTPAPANTRQALAQRRLEAARTEAAKSARDNPSAMSQQMDTAVSMEQQAEIQNVVLGAIGFVPGFDAYGRVVIQDAVGYKPFEIYKGQRNIDSPSARGLMGRSDRVHSDMVNSQYKQ